MTATAPNTPANKERMTQLHLARTGDVTTVTSGAHAIEYNTAAKTLTVYTDQILEIDIREKAEVADQDHLHNVVWDFNKVTMEGLSITQAADNHLVIDTAAGLKVFTKSPAAAEAPAETPAAPRDPALETALTIGEAAEDGWLYIGRSAKDGKPLYVMPSEAKCMDYKDAQGVAADMRAAGKAGCRIPCLQELTQIFNNVQSLPQLAHGHYWSSTRTPFGRRLKTGEISKNVSFWSLAHHRVGIQKEKPSGKGHLAIFVRN